MPEKNLPEILTKYATRVSSEIYFQVDFVRGRQQAAIWPVIHGKEGDCLIFSPNELDEFVRVLQVFQKEIIR